MNSVLLESCCCGSPAQRTSLPVVHRGRIGERSPQKLHPEAGLELPEKSKFPVVGVAAGHLWPVATPRYLVGLPVSESPALEASLVPARRLPRAHGIAKLLQLIVPVKKEIPYVVSPAMTGLVRG